MIKLTDKRKQQQQKRQKERLNTPERQNVHLQVAVLLSALLNEDKAESKIKDRLHIGQITDSLDTEQPVRQHTLSVCIHQQFHRRKK